MKEKQQYGKIILYIVLCGLIIGGTQEMGVSGGILEEVLARGRLICGISTISPLFGEIIGLSGATGFDMDFCNIVAAGLFGPDLTGKVDFLPIAIYERWNVLRNRTADVVIRTSTNTLGRDTIENMSFTVPNFYDGQGFLVPTDSPIQTLAELDQPGNTYCVTTATTTLTNALNYFTYATAVVAVNNTYRDQIYHSGGCSSVTGDVTSLLGMKTTNDRYLPGVISREPLSLVISEVDPQWTSYVSWTVQAVICSQYYGVHRGNIQDVVDFPDLPIELQYLLGVKSLNLSIPISNLWARNIISTIGNYEDIYSRQLGAEIPRRGTPNSLFTEDGFYFPLIFTPSVEKTLTPPPLTTRTLDIVRARGYLRCGSHTNSVIYGKLSSTSPGSGRFQTANGFDSSFCKAFAAAIFANTSVAPGSLDLSQYLQIVPVVNSERFTSLNNGDVDVIVFSTVPTISRDLNLAATFTDPILFTSHIIMSRLSSGLTDILLLNFSSVSYCVTEDSISYFYTIAEIPAAIPLVFTSWADTLAAFLSGQCDVIAGEQLQLLEIYTPEFFIIPTPYARLPQAAVTSDYDPKFSELIQWVRHGLILADHYNVTRQFILNLNNSLGDDPAIARLPNEMRQVLGYANYNRTGLHVIVPFFRYVIGAVGNYAEIYEEYIEPYLPRKETYNRLWSRGGILYPPPWSGQLAPVNPFPRTNSTPPTSPASKLSMACSSVFFLLFFLIQFFV